MDKSRNSLVDRPGSRQDIGRAIFGPFFENQQINTLQDYFKYYTEELHLLRGGISLDSWQVQSLATQKYEDVFKTIEILRNNVTLTRPRIRARLACAIDSMDTRSLNLSINLALRLWLMIHVQDPKFDGLRYEATCVDWDDESSLKTFVGNLFPRSRWEITAQTSRLGPHFTIAFMHRVCQLRIQWTTSLHDHLRLDKRTKTLMVFPYKGYLQVMLEYYEDSEDMGNKLPIPRQVLQETKLSLELLFPFWDRETAFLLKREEQTFHMQGPYEINETITLIDFDFWRDRLLELHEEIFQSPPVSLVQLWRDRRNPQQFWTFWVAMMILLLTVVSAAASIVQAWASVKALQYTSSS